MLPAIIKMLKQKILCNLFTAIFTIQRGEQLMLDRSGFIENIKKYKALLLLMIPGFIVVFINNYLPMFGVLIAFKRLDYSLGILKSPFVGFQNFKFLFSTEDAFRITRNTLLFNIVFIFVGILISVTIAIILNEIKNRMMSKIYQTVIILPYFMSFVVIGYIVFAFLNPDYGYMNKTVLKLFGKEDILWYSNPNYWILIIPIINFWVYSGMNSVIYLASIAAIDTEMYEAAYVDGATKWDQIKSITIPMLFPVMIVLTLLNLGNIFKGNFNLFYQVPLDSPSLYPVTDVIDTYVYRALLHVGDISMSSAAGLYQSIVGFATVYITNLFVRRIDNTKALF